jgi:hypothetical protein
MSSQFEIENAVEVMYCSEDAEHTIICATREFSKRSTGDCWRIDSVIIIASVKLRSRKRPRHRSPVTSIKGRQSALDRYRSCSSSQELDKTRAPSATESSISIRRWGVQEDNRGRWRKEPFIKKWVTLQKSGDRPTSSYKIFTMSGAEASTRLGGHRISNEIAPKNQQKSSLLLRGVRQARCLKLL